VELLTLAPSYERQRLNRKLEECSQQVEEIQSRISEASLEVENIREAIRVIDRDINRGGSMQAALRENARFRKLKRDVGKIDRDIGELDIEEAAKAKRNFETKWSQAQQRATDLMNAVRYVLHYARH
jgi:DNA repair protein RAD50